MPENKKNYLVLDIGTSSIKVFVFDQDLKPISKAEQKLGRTTPNNGWVEQDPFEIVGKSKELIRQAVKESGLKPDQIHSFGITNQRETTILWNKKTGKPV
ncbi:MAG: FGGY family carbohydrate kinase, partial [Patescibacteria group bacterium]